MAFAATYGSRLRYPPRAGLEALGFSGSDEIFQIQSKIRIEPKTQALANDRVGGGPRNLDNIQIYYYYRPHVLQSSSAQVLAQHQLYALQRQSRHREILERPEVAICPVLGFRMHFRLNPI